MIPVIDHPNILDIGCGTGASTLLLAEITDGTILALDIHQPYLDTLNKEAKKRHLDQQITTLNQSMHTMTFPDNTFDINIDFVIPLAPGIYPHTEEHKSSKSCPSRCHPAEQRYRQNMQAKI